MVLSLNPPRELRWWLSAGGLKNVRLEPVAGADPPLTFLRFVQASCRDRGWRLAGPYGAVTGLGWSGRCAGGPQAASNRFIHSCSRCQSSGRFMVRGPRPWRAVRAAMLMRSARRVARRALAYVRLARAPAARSRLQLIAASEPRARIQLPSEGQDPIAVDTGSWRSWVVEVGVFAWRGCSDCSSASSAGFSTACLP